MNSGKIVLDGTGGRTDEGSIRGPRGPKKKCQKIVKRHFLCSCHIYHDDPEQLQNNRIIKRIWSLLVFFFVQNFTTAISANSSPLSFALPFGALWMHMETFSISVQAGLKGGSLKGSRTVAAPSSESTSGHRLPHLHSEGMKVGFLIYFFGNWYDWLCFHFQFSKIYVGERW